MSANCNIEVVPEKNMKPKKLTLKINIILTKLSTVYRLQIYVI